MRFFEKQNPLKRLYRISLGGAIVISLPFFILGGWMIFNAYLDYHRFVNIVAKQDYVAEQESPSFNKDILHFFLHGNFLESINRFNLPEMPNDDSMPVFQVQIRPEYLAMLNSDLPESGKEKYYKAFVQYEDESYTVKVRYRGGGHWHWHYPQKSWRVKTKKKKLIDGLRKVNLVNPKTILSFEEAFSMDLAEQVGLLAPKCKLVKFILNNQYMGVYYYWEQVDESLLRRNMRMPGSIYSDNGAVIWKKSKAWKKVASRNAEQKLFRGDIEQFIEAINNPSLQDYYYYVKKHLNIEKYSLYLAFDNLTGTVHHDFVHNFKLYFDPFLGKFEFIPWDQHMWFPSQVVGFDMANPPLNKWKLIPEFDLIRQQTLWRLLQEELTIDSLQSLLENYIDIVRPALMADPYRDAIDGDFPNILKFPTLGVSYFTMHEFYNAVEGMRKTVIDRYEFLTHYLQKDEIYAFLDSENKEMLKFISNGNVGALLENIKFYGRGQGELTLYKDLNRNGVIDEDDPSVASCQGQDNECLMTLSEQLLPGYKRIKRKSLTDMWGDSVFFPTGLEYQYILDGNFSIDTFSVTAVNAVTGENAHVILSPPEEYAAGQAASIHPWDLPLKPELREETLGPGIITVNDTMIFPENVLLRIMPGTTLRMAEGASIFCYGKVEANGTADKPIRIEAIDPAKPWGVFVLQGEGADGSQFAWCSWRDGSIATKDLIYYSGMVSVHDVDDLQFENCRIGRNHLGDDSLHLAYCQNFLVDGLFFENARSDAMDVDISTGRITASRFVDSGNDSLDFMTSNAVVSGCYFDGSKDKGISVGEKSDVLVSDSVFENCGIGLEIKDQSVVDFRENVIRFSPLAVNLYKKNWRYDGGGNLVADTIFAINCAESLKKDKKSKAEFHEIVTVDPHLHVWDETKMQAGCCVPGRRVQ